MFALLYNSLNCALLFSTLLLILAYFIIQGGWTTVKLHLSLLKSRASLKDELDLPISVSKLVCTHCQEGNDWGKKDKVCFG